MIARRRNNKNMTNTSTSTELIKAKNISAIRDKLGITRKEFSDALV